MGWQPDKPDTHWTKVRLRSFVILNGLRTKVQLGLGLGFGLGLRSGLRSGSGFVILRTKVHQPNPPTSCRVHGGKPLAPGPQAELEAGPMDQENLLELAQTYEDKVWSKYSLAAKLKSGLELRSGLQRTQSSLI